MDGSRSLELVPNRKRPLKVGLHLPQAEGMMDGQTPRWDHILAMARLAEEVGFDSLWVMDHLLMRFPDRETHPVGIWEGWSLLAALAATTTRITLGPFVTCTGYRNPALLAKMADTVDEISGGRLILGLGAGWHEPEYTAFGFPYDYRVSRFEEAFTIIRSLLREGHVDFAGHYYQARDCELRPRGPRPGGPPLLVGTTGPRMLRITVPYVDAWNTDWTSGPDVIPPLREAVDVACREVGRDPATLERTAAVLVDLPGRHALPGEDFIEDIRVEIGPPMSGSPEVLAHHLGAYAAEGIDHLQVWIAPLTLSGIEGFASVLEVLDRG
jgi:alkanesulfonate monooxygenase SsuD/methylene tetrahydromethanopterin reductase-like flavin-dependent oxidoreductase (luciferase family)